MTPEEFKTIVKFSKRRPRRLGGVRHPMAIEKDLQRVLVFQFIKQLKRDAIDDETIFNFGVRVDKHVRRQVNRIFRPFGAVDFTNGVVDEQGVRTFVARIARYFERNTEEYNQRLAAGERSEDLLELAKSKSALIARTEVAKLNADLTRARHADLGISRFKWRTMKDERVRDDHSSLDGQEFEYGSAPFGGPGNDFQCRCFSEPVLP